VLIQPVDVLRAALRQMQYERAVDRHGYN